MILCLLIGESLFGLKLLVSYGSRVEYNSLKFLESVAFDNCRNGFYEPLTAGDRSRAVRVKLLSFSKKGEDENDKEEVNSQQSIRSAAPLCARVTFKWSMYV